MRSMQDWNSRLRYALGILKTQPVFVIGTGRSGTHWLGYALENHPEVRATIELQPMFGLSVSMALNPTLEGRLFGRLVRAYKWQLLISSTPVYLDKSHPNVWIAEKLKDAFPKSRFVAIQRNPYATVASMLKHKGVLAWHRRWKEFPIPNRFLGITQELAHVYDALPLAAQCAWRWLATCRRIEQLRQDLGSDIFVVSYEAFARDTSSVVRLLKEFLTLSKPIPLPNVKSDSLHKWKHQLSDEQIKQIQEVVGFSADAYV